MGEPAADQPRPLEFATNEELWDEFSSRFNRCLFVYCHPEKGNEQTKDMDTGVIWKGGWVMANGLSELAKMALQRNRSTTEEEEA